MWTSKDDPTVVFFTDGGVPKVRVNQGNWMQGQGGERLINPRYFFSWSIDGGPWSAPYPPSRTPPGETVPGEGDSVRALLSGVHRYTVLVAASNFHQGWGDAPGDWHEWGWQNVEGTDYRINFDATGTIGPPPKPAVTIPHAELTALVTELEASLAYQMGWGRVVRPTKALRAKL